MPWRFRGRTSEIVYVNKAIGNTQWEHCHWKVVGDWSNQLYLIPILSLLWLETFFPHSFLNCCDTRFSHFQLSLSSKHMHFICYSSELSHDLPIKLLPALKKWSKCKQDFPGGWEEEKGIQALNDSFICLSVRLQTQKQVPLRVQQLSDCSGPVFYLNTYSSAKEILLNDPWRASQMFDRARFSLWESKKMVYRKNIQSS